MESGNHFNKKTEVQTDLFELNTDPDRQVTPWKPVANKWGAYPDQWRKDWEHLKKRFSEGLGGGFSFNGKKWPVPWTKIILLALAVYVLTFKDLQFSLDMKAPLGPGSAEVPPVAPRSVPTQTTSIAAATEADEQEDIHAYIARFRKVAMAEMQKYAIPASVKLAQGLLESQAGRSQDARQSNNHFGTPLAGEVFNSAWANWRAHSELLKNEYPELFRLDMNYKAWARGLEQSGYNPREGYADQLIRLIETYRLFELDGL